MELDFWYYIDIWSYTAALYVLVVLSVWNVAQAFCKRLWLLPSHPSRLLALNAGTLALLSIAAKPEKPGNYDAEPLGSQESTLAGIVRLCAVVGALMPSIAASTDLKDMWSNVIGVGTLIITTSFIIFLRLFYEPDTIENDWVPGERSISNLARGHKCVMASLLLLLLVLVVQAMALEEMMLDVKAIVLEQLQRLRMETIKPGYIKASSSTSVALMKAERPAAAYTNWSWEVVERNTCIKLMMVVTSNPQHVMARSQCAAIVGVLVLCSLGASNLLCIDTIEGSCAGFCALICMWRWARVALQEDRPFLSLLSDAQPSYWRRKLNNFKRIPNYALKPEGQYRFKETVVRHTTAFLMLCFVLLVAMIRFTHFLSALLVQRLIRPPLRLLGCGIPLIFIKPLIGKRQVVNTITEPGFKINLDSDLGVVCLDGEDARIVRREFAGAVDVIIRKQLKKGKTKSDLNALKSLLQRFKNTSPLTAGTSTYGCMLHLLHQDNAPKFVENEHVEHGYQYGWSLTAVSLLAIMNKIEVAALGRSEMFEAAMDAYWQAMEMIDIVDEQFRPCIVCSKETYTRAVASEWSKLPKKKRRWPHQKQARPEVHLDVVGQVLKDILEPITKQTVAFENTAKGVNRVAAAWPLQTVVSYTMHTVCQSLLRWWTDLENARTADNEQGGGVEVDNATECIKAMVEHINGLIAQLVACCLSNFPTALDMSMTGAVLRGSITKIEKGLFLVGQGKYLWEELQWPSTLHSPTSSTGLGLL